MEIKEFGAKLLLSKDLDPLYVLLNEARERELLPYPQLAQFCLAYWCFYHAGVAAWICDDWEDEDKFWIRMSIAAQNTRKEFPRGKERRHFRGNAAIESVYDLNAQRGIWSNEAQKYWGAEEIVTAAHRATFKDTAKAVKKWVGFGNWMAFKVADMFDRVLMLPVDFSDCALDMYDGPIKGAELYIETYASWTLKGTNTTKGYKVNHAVKELLEHFKGFDAPPSNDRKVNIQEVETILCKWKSHMNGHYYVGEDIHDLKKALLWIEQESKLSKVLTDVCAECFS